MENVTGKLYSSRQAGEKKRQHVCDLVCVYVFVSKVEKCVAIVAESDCSTSLQVSSQFIYEEIFD